MRPAIVALLLFIPLATAAELPPLPEPSPSGACVEAGCVRAVDTDGDEEIDWVNAAVRVGPVTTNANADEADLLLQADLTTDELGGHDVEDALEGAGVEAPVLTVSAIGASWSEDDERRATLSLLVYETDHDTGQDATLVERDVLLP